MGEFFNICFFPVQGRRQYIPPKVGIFLQVHMALISRGPTSMLLISL
jgi:hypothetical protein